MPLKDILTGNTYPSSIVRQWGTASVAVNSVLANCDVVDMRELADAAVKPPTGVTSLTFYGCETESGTFVLIDDVGTAGVVTVTADKWQKFPDKIFPHGFIKMVSAGANGNAVIVGKT